jgi:uncharacterized protein (DUF488 family)
MRTIFTIGHSNRALETFIAMLDDAGVQVLADVRARPASRRHPQFDRLALTATLRQAGIDYLWMGDRLGGFRRPVRGSPHLALDGAFRGFADYMASTSFQAAADELLASSARTAIMCAERTPEECHRSLITDALLIRGGGVEHLLDPGVARPGELSPTARIENGRLIYDRGAQATLLG